MSLKKCLGEKLILMVGVLFIITGCATAQVKRESVKLITDDQKMLSADYYPPVSASAPGIILLPDTRCDRMAFGSIPRKLNEAGFAVLSMDFRYKEIIAKTKSRKEAISTIQKQNLMALMKHDTKSGINFLLGKKEVDPERIALIGTSLGSRVAIISGGEYNLKALVLISLSGEEAFPGHKSNKQLLSEYGNKPILFMTATKDWGGNYKAAEHNKSYYEWARGEKELKIWSGAGHGIEILEKKEATDFVILWLKNNL